MPKMWAVSEVEGMTLTKLYERRKANWEDNRPSGRKMTIKADRTKKDMNWNGLKPKRKEQTAQ